MTAHARIDGRPVGVVAGKPRSLGGALSSEAASFARSADHLTAASAAAEGVIDEIVAPSSTRARLMAARRALSTPERPVRPARNIQL